MQLPKQIFQICRDRAKHEQQYYHKRPKWRRREQRSEKCLKRPCRWYEQDDNRHKKVRRALCGADFLCCFRPGIDVPFAHRGIIACHPEGRHLARYRNDRVVLTI